MQRKAENYHHLNILNLDFFVFHTLWMSESVVPRSNCVVCRGRRLLTTSGPNQLLGDDCAAPYTGTHPTPGYRRSRAPSEPGGRAPRPCCGGLSADVLSTG